MAKIRIRRSTLRHIGYILLALAIAIVAVVLIRLAAPGGGETGGDTPRETRRTRLLERPKEMYGIIYNDFELETKKIGNGQTLSHLLGGMGVGPAMIDKIERAARPVYNMRGMRAGNNYTAFFSKDSEGRRKLEHFVYEKDQTEYIVVSLKGDSVAVRKYEKEVTVVRRKETAKIETSLWHSMVKNDLPPSLSVELENIYGWSVDFFHLQEGDTFTVIFDERYIDTTRIGVGRVWGAEFSHRGKTYYAIPFRQDGKVQYWDESGKSMKKQFLKAPLKYTRISSGYTTRRLHPVHKVYRAHLGIDYAAPTGTPVLAIADGTVITKQWDSKGGGNYLKIQHSNNYVSTYMHLNGYAKGIKVGSRVSQGQLIAYVGTTGTSTGPHLDFRMQKNGQYINPLSLPSSAGEPLKEGNKTVFNAIRDKVMAELKGNVPDGEKLTEL